MEKDIKVSVCMITYNHEKYIEEAINGILMQVCDFEIELIIANDASTDSTDEVITNIIQNHSNGSWIKYSKHKFNLGMMPNFIWAMQQCKGEYIALCDGDDYWVDPQKLQKQVDFFEANSNYVACIHNASIINEFNEISESFCDWNSNREIYPKDIILRGGGIYPTASLIFRNKIQLPSFTFATKAGDSALAFSLLGKGDFYYLNEIMCVYRKHDGGVYTSIRNNKRMKFIDFKSNITLLNNYRLYYECKFKNYFDNSIQNQLIRISNNFGFQRVLIMTLTGTITFKDFAHFFMIKLKNKI